MAPITKSGLRSQGSRATSFHSQSFREDSWDFAGSEPRSAASLETSEAPGSINGHDGDYENYGNDSRSQAILEGPADADDILHPLRQAAIRVGREVELFSKTLDEYNPLKAADDLESRQMTLSLVANYYKTASDTVARLRERHRPASLRRDGTGWTKKVQESRTSQDEEMIDADEGDEAETSHLESEANSTTVHDLTRWEQEARTWDLLLQLIRGKHGPASNIQSGPIHRYSSRGQVWNNFLESEDQAWERSTILSWLRQTADECREEIDVLVHDLQQNAERGDIFAHGWLHTKSAIKAQKRTQPWSNSANSSSRGVQKGHLNASGTELLVTELDPDATTRQGRRLEAQDEFFERAIWLGCYELLRRGKSASEIKEWCSDRTEIWRAVSMSGVDSDDNAQTFDYSARALWRRMCFALSRRGGSDKYERAVYGLVSGDLLSLEPVCRSWDDFLFAHYNAVLQSQYEIYLRSRFSNVGQPDVAQNFGVFDALQFLGDSPNLGHRVVELLKGQPELKTETQQPMKMLQGVLIAKRFGHFIYQQGLALSKFANKDSPSHLLIKLDIDPEDEANTRYITPDDHDSMRVLVHMLLALKSLGLDLGTDVKRYAIENVIVSYISFLRLAGLEELIPLYAAQLSGDRIYSTLSRELLDVTDNTQRATQIRLMKELGLDVQQFVRFQTRFLLADFPDSYDGYPASGKFRILGRQDQSEFSRKIRSDFIGKNIDRVDILLIRSLEWHMHVEGLWSETFRTGCLLYKRFYKNMKLAAARELAMRVSSELISERKTFDILGESIGLEALQSENYEASIIDRLDREAQQEKTLKRYLVSEGQSFRDLEKLIEALDYIEGVGIIVDEWEAARTNESGKKESRINFHGHFSDIQRSVKGLLRGWLVTSQNEEPEFKILRETYLPEVILAYDGVLHFAGLLLSRDNFLECLDLATIIAAEDSDLADLFVRTGRMPELVTALAGDSTALLFSTAPGKSKPTPSKRLRELGWRRDVWNIKV